MLSRSSSMSPCLPAASSSRKHALANSTSRLKAGREDAFVWPSIVRVGDEARKLAMQRLGTEGNSGISSPRRYLWDETPVVQDWRFSQMNSNASRWRPRSR